MILTGRSLCLPSPATVHELFSVARDAAIVPDVSLDPVLTSFLSPDSRAALQHQYDFLQRSLSGEQQTEFNLTVSRELGGSSVTHGGVGVVALALSLLFDLVAQQIRSPGWTRGSSLGSLQPERVYGISSSSRLGWIIYSYLRLVPGLANDEEGMAEATELYDKWLKLEMLDHYMRMTTKKRMSSASFQQWLTGAAFHLHMRIHQVRLHSVPLGSAESLRLSYKSGLGRLIQGYTSYLRTNIQEVAPGSVRPRPETQRSTNVRSMNCSNPLVHLTRVGTNTSTDGANRTSTTNTVRSRGCGSHGSRGEVGRGGSKESKGLAVSEEDVMMLRDEEESDTLGLLIIEPGRNVSHSVKHHPCESPAIQQALVTRVIDAQDLTHNGNYFMIPEAFLFSLLRQKDDFQLKTS